MTFVLGLDYLLYETKCIGEKMSASSAYPRYRHVRQAFTIAGDPCIGVPALSTTPFSQLSRPRCLKWLVNTNRMVSPSRGPFVALRVRASNACDACRQRKIKVCPRRIARRTSLY